MTMQLKVLEVLTVLVYLLPAFGSGSNDCKCGKSFKYSRVSNKNIVSNKAWSLTKNLVYYIKLQDFSDFWPIFASK